MPSCRIPIFFDGCCVLTRSWRARRERQDVRAAAFCTALTIRESPVGARRKCTPTLLGGSASAATIVVVGRPRCPYVSWAGAALHDPGDSVAYPGALAPVVERTISADRAMASVLCALHAAGSWRLPEPFAGAFCRRRHRSHGASSPLSGADHGPAEHVAWGVLMTRRRCR